MFQSTDRKRMFQAHRSGFTFNQFPPVAWDVVRDEARRLWGNYRNVMNPVQVNRAAVRLLYRLELPLPAAMKDYLRTFPEVAPGLSQGLTGFLMQLRMPQPDIQGTLLLSETVLDPGQPDACSVVLDVDMFREAAVPQDEGGIWQTIESLYGRNTDVFEACITEKARELLR
jgi:uncharacterized protein (TIGR04255 family)